MKIYCGYDDLNTREATKRLELFFEEHNVLLQKRYDFEFIFSIGGDGTLLDAFSDNVDRLSEVAFVGIHTGHLGFYTDWLIDEIDKLLDALLHANYTFERFPIMTTCLHYSDGTTKTLKALNEITVLNSIRTIHLDVALDTTYFESFRGTGICVSTPSGSTAYNKSLQGAIVNPEIKAMQLAEIASLNNNVYRTIASSLIVSEKEMITLTSPNFKNSVITIDRGSLPLDDVTRIKTYLKGETISFVRLRPYHFWERVRRSFLQD